MFAVIATQDELLATIAVPASTVTLAGTASANPPGVLLWKETIPIPNPSSAPFDTTRGQQLVFHDGYVYVFGGKSANDERLTAVNFSGIRPDGTLAGWTETTSLPGKFYDHVVVETGDYAYLLTGAAGVEDVYYALFSADGSLGGWKETASLSPSRQTFAAVSYGDFIYAAGGNSGGTRDFVQYSAVGSDGSLHPWAHTTPLPVASQEHTMIAYDGYLYVIGSRNQNAQRVPTVYFSAINPDGSLAKWNTTTPLPQKMSGFTAFEANGYVYILGGDSSSYYSRILEDGTLDTWQTATSLPSIRLGLRAGAYDGYAYAIGGYDFVSYQSTVYYSWIGLRPPVDRLILEHSDCTSGWTRLSAGGRAAVSGVSATQNLVRAGPSTVETSIALLYPGSVVELLEGPICADGVVFWKVGSDLVPGGIGWTAEGDGADYFLEPYVP